jgi:hypothetical protein
VSSTRLALAAEQRAAEMHRAPADPDAFHEVRGQRDQRNRSSFRREEPRGRRPFGRELRVPRRPGGSEFASDRREHEPRVR